MLARSFLGGLTLSSWARLLRENRFRILPRCLPTAALITADAGLTSLFSSCEPPTELDQAAERLWSEPVFILGLPRSGTTYLQSLMALNPELAYPSRLDCFHPRSFRTLHRLGLASLLGRLGDRKRSLDNVRVGWLSPDEDEFALTALTADGPWMGVVFGERLEYYRARSPRDDVWEGRRAWCEALSHFTRKLVAHYRRRVVLKSPLHMMRIPDILSVFPSARFVTLLRDPIRQTQSTLSGADVYQRHPWPALQRFEASRDDYLDGNADLLARYFTVRDRIAPDHLIELTYESLVRGPESELIRIHEHLGLPGLEALQRRLGDPDAPRTYQTNPHRELTIAERRRVLSIFEPMFQAGHYLDTYRRLIMDDANLG